MALQFTAIEFSSGKLFVVEIIEAGEENNPKSHPVRSVPYIHLLSKEKENLGSRVVQSPIKLTRPGLARILISFL